MTRLTEAAEADAPLGDDGPLGAETTSRRSLITRSVAALGALLAGGAIRSTAARASDGDQLILGTNNDSSASTVLIKDATPPLQSAFAVATNQPGGVAISGNGPFRDGGTGVEGWSFGGCGVRGLSLSLTSPPATPGIGVFGYADEDGDSIAVEGESTIGTGVLGVATTGGAVKGKNTSSTVAAVKGENGGTGPGVVGTSEGTGPGVSGTSEAGDGVLGFGGVALGSGVHGKSGNPTGAAVFGESLSTGYGVRGSTNGGPTTAAVWGDNAGSGPGVKGQRRRGRGVRRGRRLRCRRPRVHGPRP